MNSLSWSDGSGSTTDSMLTAIRAGNKLREPTPVPCPNRRCPVRGRRIRLHCLWCQFQAVHLLPGRRRVATGHLKRVADDGGAEFISFNKSFEDTLGIIFEWQEAGNKLRIRCRGGGGENVADHPYTIIFSINNFDYKICGRTAEIKPHRLVLPVRLNKRKLFRYTITVRT